MTMERPDLRALPPLHEQLWRQAGPDASEVLRELQRQKVTPNEILVVVASPGSQAGELLEDCLPGWVIASPCPASPATPVIAVMAGSAVAEFVEDHPVASEYIAGLPGHLCAVIVLAGDGPVISACRMPYPTEAGLRRANRRPPRSVPPRSM